MLKLTGTNAVQRWRKTGSDRGHVQGRYESMVLKNM